MQSHFYPLAETPFFNQTVQRYYSGDAALRPFYAFPPTLDAVHQAVQAKSQQPINRNALVEALLKQYEPLRNTEHNVTVQQNIESLRQPNTFTVTTAHQPHLLLGPLYVTYKIISVIRLAEQCRQRYPDYNFVPTFWLGSEDHDLDELGNVTVFDKTIALTNVDYKGPFGRMPIEKLNAVRDELYNVLGTSEQANAIKQLLNDHYFSQPTVAAATRSLAHKLFGQYGLVVVDGDDATLKKNLIPVMLDEVEKQSGYNIVTNSINGLVEIGLGEQAHPREVNLFYLQDNLRERIIPEGEKFKVNHTEISFTKAQLVAEIQTNPHHFSPNVILRPLYQTTTLPDVIFTGGPAEVGYWLQLKSLFEHHQAVYPMILLRDSFVYIDKISQQRLQKFGIGWDELLKPIDKWTQDYLAKQEDGNVNFDEYRKQLEVLMQDVSTKVLQADGSLQSSIEGEKVKMLKSIETLEAKAQKAAKKKHETAIGQLQKLKDKLFPNGKLAERRNGVWEYLLTNPNFIHDVAQHADPFNAGIKAIAD